MAANKLFKFILLIISLSLPAKAVSQEDFSRQIVGIWSVPYKTAASEGILIMDFSANHGLKITLSVTIDGIKNVAFSQSSGLWKTDGSTLLMSISSTTSLRWTAEIAKQLSEYDIDSDLSYSLLEITQSNLPTLKQLHISEKMRIRHIKDNKLTISELTGSTPITLTTRKSYPSGGKMALPKQIATKRSESSTGRVQPTLNGVKNEIVRDQKRTRLNNLKDELDDALNSMKSTKVLYKKQVVTKQSYLNTLKSYKYALQKYAEAGGDVTYYPTDDLSYLTESNTNSSASTSTERSKTSSRDSHNTPTAPAEATAKAPDTEKIYNAVEEQPKFPGGNAELYKVISQNIRYPEMAAQNNIQGRILVQFIVEPDGSIGEVKVVRGKDPELDAEAVRLVKTLPKFSPGKMNGQAVRCWYTLPINFKL